MESNISLTAQKDQKPHSFHIPVLGLGYSIDSPLKVARFGIDSVVSIMEDALIENMRKIHSRKNGIPYLPILETEPDARAKRITAYLNLLQTLVDQQFNQILSSDFDEEGSEINKYFEMLQPGHPLTVEYESMKVSSGEERLVKQVNLINKMKPGVIDVNIMTKVDKPNFARDGRPMPAEFSDALAALRGFADSRLQSSVVFSAGINPSLYGYLEHFKVFYPDSQGKIAKKVILKVSDYRSALIQGRFLAKKGIWISEFRVESGLNCGGHAFASNGQLLGPILEEFREKREELRDTLWQLCQETLASQNKSPLAADSSIKITAQGGIGTAWENQLLMDHYKLDGTGWGSPFLLVPEATSVDQDTLEQIINAREEDFFLSNASPLGVPFNNLRSSSGEKQRLERIQKGRPGSPCYKKVLSTNTEFTDQAICTSSRQYMHLKLKQLDEAGEGATKERADLLAKDCLCEGLGASAIIANGDQPDRNLNAVTICPGPNLAYFKRLYSLQEMVGNIYGRYKINLSVERPNFFIKELQLNIDFLLDQFGDYKPAQGTKVVKEMRKSMDNLQQGIKYYLDKAEDFNFDSQGELSRFKTGLDQAWNKLAEKISPFFDQMAEVKA